MSTTIKSADVQTFAPFADHGTAELAGDMARTFAKLAAKIGRTHMPPVLRSVAIRPGSSPGLVTLFATDLDTFAWCEGPGTITGPGFLVDVGTFAAGVKAAGTKADRVPLELAGGQITSGPITASIGAAIPEDYPRIGWATQPAGLPELTAENVALLAAHVSRDELRPVLTHAVWSDGAYVTTDSYRLAMLEPAYGTDTSGAADWSAGFRVLELAGRIPAAGRRMTCDWVPVVCPDNRAAGLETETETRSGERVVWSIGSRAMDPDTFPNYRRIADLGAPAAWWLEADLSPIFAAIGKPSAKAGATVILESDGNGISWSVKSATENVTAAGRTIGELDHPYPPGSVRIGYNARFLLAHAGPGGTLRVYGPDAAKAELGPSIADHPGHGTYRARTLLMPVRI